MDRNTRFDFSTLDTVMNFLIVGAAATVCAVVVALQGVLPAVL